MVNRNLLYPRYIIIIIICCVYKHVTGELYKNRKHFEMFLCFLKTDIKHV